MFQTSFLPHEMIPARAPQTMFSGATWSRLVLPGATRARQEIRECSIYDASGFTRDYLELFDAFRGCQAATENHGMQA